MPVTPRARPGRVLLTVALLTVAGHAAAVAATPVGEATGSVVGVLAGAGTGTGFVVDGGVLTAAHVVQDAEDVTIRWDGDDRPGRVIRVDAALDLALVEVELAGAAPLVLDPEPELGEPVTVVAVDPFIGPALTRGIVSAMPVEAGVQLLQVDAAVNPGTSGGPVLGDDGRVLGLVISKDPLHDDVGRAHVAADLAAFLAGTASTARSVPVADVPAPAPVLDAPLSPLVPVAVAGAVLALGLVGLLRSRIPRRDDLSIELGPVTAVDPHERHTT